MDDNKVWAFSNTGRSHAFVATAGLGRRRAMCSARVERAETSIFKTFDWAKINLPCGKCQTLYLAMVARAEASMEPVNPYDQVCEGVVTSEGAARVADDKPLPPGMNRELLRQAKAVQEAHKRLFPVEVAETNALNEQTIANALHEEALREDAERTAAELGIVSGGKYEPLPVPSAEYGQDVREALRTLRAGAERLPSRYRAAFRTLDAAGLFAALDVQPEQSPSRWYYTAVVKADGYDNRRVGGFVTAAGPLAAEQVVREDWKGRLEFGEYLDYLQIVPV